MQPISLSQHYQHARWEAARFSRRASRVLARNQLLLKALPTAAGYAGGDCLTQMLGPLWPADDWPSKRDWAKHDPSKTLLMAGVGAGVGAPASLALYAWMNAAAPGSGQLLAAAKFAADQAVGCLLWQASYMAISEPYRRTFLAFADAQRQRWQQQQQQQQQQGGGGGSAVAPAALAATAPAPASRGGGGAGAPQPVAAC